MTTTGLGAAKGIVTEVGEGSGGAQPPQGRASSPGVNEQGGREVKAEDARSNSALVFAVKAKLGDLERVAPPEEDPGVYKDWGDEEEFKAKVGKGECAGP